MPYKRKTHRKYDNPKIKAKNREEYNHLYYIRVTKPRRRRGK